MNILLLVLLAWVIGSIPVAAGFCYLISQGKKKDAYNREVFRLLSAQH